MADDAKKLFLLLWSAGQMTVAPHKTTRHGTHYSATIAIGKDHTATITMTDDALKELCAVYGFDMADDDEQFRALIGGLE